MKAGNGTRDKMERRKSGKKREDKGERGKEEVAVRTARITDTFHEFKRGEAMKHEINILRPP